ncbi:hypothetical protein [Aminobacter sp. MDW-2]|uniref:hypothetical protein n=1 Tax=Aminobacter sp. MDW-2 TaxID=2666139 RepID=UPI0012B08D98|nr:hypothetical protein [Aminobacter sp. MDW-2]MRX32826.1 hypothetical protein [Aminobacter sp. MDW-2]QNH34516.1 hypothetical protein H5P29_00745 [Aminobacter sp. MDW-2]
MQVAPPPPPDKVSFHAVTRYVQRVLGIFVPASDPPKEPPAVAFQHCTAAGTTIEAVRDLILVPSVVAASLSGLSQAFARDFRAQLDPKTGVVMTIMERPPTATHKLRVRSKKEARSLAKQMGRRQRRREDSGS